MNGLPLTGHLAYRSNIVSAKFGKGNQVKADTTFHKTSMLKSLIRFLSSQATRFRAVLSMILCILVLSAPLSTRADEVAFSIGQRYGGSFEDNYTAAKFDVEKSSSYGVVLDFDSALQEQIEIYISRQDTRLTTGGLFTGNPLFDLYIDCFHVGGLVLYGHGDEMRPFISGTFGMTQMTPKRADLSTVNKASISLGGGGKVFLNRQIGLRFEVRAIYTALDANSDIFCANGGCSIKVSSSGFIQTEFSTSLVVRF